MNGFANYETWNAALWVANDESLYNTAKACVEYCGDNETPWDKFVRCMMNGQIGKFLRETGDGVAWNHPDIDTDKMNEILTELWTMDILEMLTQRENLMENIDSIVTSFFDDIELGETGIDDVDVNELILRLCDAVCENFPTTPTNWTMTHNETGKYEPDTHRPLHELLGDCLTAVCTCGIILIIALWSFIRIKLVTSKVLL